MKVPLYSVPTTDVRGWMNLSQLKDLVSLQSLKLLFRSHEYRVRLQYEIIGHWSYFAEQTLFMNMGYWDSSTTSLDDACRAMARMVGERGEFSPQDQILDAGFGFADQDMFWIDTFAPRRIDGVNISPTQVRTGRKRVAERGLDSRIQLSMASATALPFEDRSFSKVVSLESAFHFVTREDFFREAWRVLRPGGRLIVTDIISLPGRPASKHALKQNSYARDVYAEKLSQTGFANVAVESIREQTCLPFIGYLARRLHEPDIVRRINPWTRRNLLAFANAADPCADIDYVIVSADKPPA
jgi:ubiquinone/menaquinone biosynthesis C-methylase UbiE